MTRPRRTLVCIDDTPFYHITSRCVRRSFLCGFDHATGNDYEYRRLYIEQRIHLLSSIFAIDIAAYAVMSNHVHLVVKLTPEVIDGWSDTEVLQRWTALFKGPRLVQQQLAGHTIHAAEKESLKKLIATYRERLGELGWFMKCLNEPIARMANKEDNCRGHFWEARYNSQALLTEEALLSCMAYVDLNPIRAQMDTTPETSRHTSVKERIQPSLNLADNISTLIQEQGFNHFSVPLKALLTFDGNVTEDQQSDILFSQLDYLTLVDTTGRIIRDDKRGAIPLHLSPILTRLGIDRKTWLTNTTRFEKVYQKQFAKKRRSLKQTA